MFSQKRKFFIFLLIFFAVLNFDVAFADNDNFDCENFKSKYSLRETNENYLVCLRARDNKISFEEMYTGALLATRDLAVHRCPDVKLSADEKEFRDNMLKNQIINRVYEAYYEEIYYISVYSMENWCHEYGTKNSIFILR